MTSTSIQNPSLIFMAITARAANYAIQQQKKGTDLIEKLFIIKIMLYW